MSSSVATSGVAGSLPVALVLGTVLPLVVLVCCVGCAMGKRWVQRQQELDDVKSVSSVSEDEEWDPAALLSEYGVAPSPVSIALLVLATEAQESQTL